MSSSHSAAKKHISFSHHLSFVIHLHLLPVLSISKESFQDKKEAKDAGAVIHPYPYLLNNFWNKKMILHSFLDLFFHHAYTYVRTRLCCGDESRWIHIQNDTIQNDAIQMMSYQNRVTWNRISFVLFRSASFRLKWWTTFMYGVFSPNVVLP